MLTYAILAYLIIGLLWGMGASLYAKQWNPVGMAVGVVIVMAAWPYFVYAGIKAVLRP